MSFLVRLAIPALAEDNCTVKAVLGGTAVTMKHCAVALYDSEHSVTLVFSNTAFTAKQIAGFQCSSAPPEKDSTQYLLFHPTIREENARPGETRHLTSFAIVLAY